MFKKILIILSGIGFFYSATVFADAQMFRYFRTDEGNYNEYNVRGYDIQPNRSGLWNTGCRTDDYYCMGALERAKFQAEFDRTIPAAIRRERR